MTEWFGTEWFETARLVLGVGFVGIGAIFVLIGALGLVRLKDLYQRMHGAGVVDTGGAGLVLFGLLLLVPDWQVAVRLLLIGALLVFTSPTATHAIARAAHFAGDDTQTNNGKNSEDKNG